MGNFHSFVMMVYGWLIFSLQIWDHLPAMLFMIVVTAITMSAVGQLISPPFRQRKSKPEVFR